MYYSWPNNHVNDAIQNVSDIVGNITKKYY